MKLDLGRKKKKGLDYKKQWGLVGMRSKGSLTLKVQQYPCVRQVCTPFCKWCHLLLQPNQLHCRELSELRYYHSVLGACSCHTSWDQRRSWQRSLSSAALFACCSLSPSMSEVSSPTSSKDPTAVTNFQLRRQLPCSHQKTRTFTSRVQLTEGGSLGSGLMECDDERRE